MRKTRPWIVVTCIVCTSIPPGCGQQRVAIDEIAVSKYKMELADRAAGMLMDVEAVAIPQRFEGGQAGALPLSPITVDEHTGLQTIRLSLQEAVRRGVEHSLAAKTQSYLPAISAAAVVAAEAAFDATFFANYSHDRLDTPINPFRITTVTRGTDIIPIPLRETNTRSTNYALGFRKRLPTGATVQSSWQMSRVAQEPLRGEFAGGLPDTFPFRAAHDADLIFEINQPILRGMGTEVNHAEIHIAQNDRRISQLTFKRSVIDAVASIERAYWDLFNSWENLDIRQRLLKSAEETYKKIYARGTYDADRVQISRAASEVHTRKADLIDARNQLRIRADQLKVLINDPSLPLDEVIAIIPTDRPTQEHYIPDRSDAVEVAIEKRTEVGEAQLAVDNSDLRLVQARDALLPRLDAVVRTSINGLGDQAGSAVAQQEDLDYVDYQFAIEYEMPIGNRAAKAVVKAQRFDKKRTKTQLRQIRENVIFEVNTAVNQLESFYQQLQARKAELASRSDNLRALEERESVGTRLTPDFLELKLDAQEDHGRAALNLVSAKIQYNNALVELFRSKGELLQYNRITIETAPEQGR